MATRTCNGEYKKCMHGLTCAKPQFPCENEKRRRKTATRIRSGEYFMDKKHITVPAVLIAKRNEKVLRGDAYCGDGLLRYCLGKLFRDSKGSVSKASHHWEMNSTLARIVLERPALFKNPNGKSTHHSLGTIYEAHLFGVFESEGRDAAIRFVGETIGCSEEKIKKALET